MAILQNRVHSLFWNRYSAATAHLSAPLTTTVSNSSGVLELIIGSAESFSEGSYHGCFFHYAAVYRLHD
jgi:hypothetical protein